MGQSAFSVGRLGDMLGSLSISAKSYSVEIFSSVRHFNMFLCFLNKINKIYGQSPPIFTLVKIQLNSVGVLPNKGRQQDIFGLRYLSKHYKTTK